VFWHYLFPTPRWVRRTVDLMLANVALFLVLGEVVLQTYTALGGRSLLVANNIDARRLRPCTVYGDYWTTNEQGYQSRSFERECRSGVRRLAVLGDSFAVGLVPKEDNFLNRQESESLEIYNFGVPGIGPADYLHILEHEVWTYRPDEVLVCVFVGNDVLHPSATGPLSRSAPERSKLYLLSRRLRRIVREWRSQGQLDFMRRPRSNFNHETYVGHELSLLPMCRKTTTELVAQRWEVALSSLAGIIDACRRHHTPVRFVLIPDEFQVDAGLLEEMLVRGSIPRDDVDVSLPQRRLRALFDEYGVRCLDLLPGFAGRPGLYHPNDSHWNKAGNHLAAQLLAAWMKQ
ncbi:MAG: hypothetical protein AB7K24_34420, partial [Gemmataceae bacterium]